MGNLPVTTLKPTLGRPSSNSSHSVTTSITGDVRIKISGLVTGVAFATVPMPQLRVSNGILSRNFNPLPSSVQSPVNVQRLYSLLVEHPQQALVSYVVNGFTHEFDIGFRDPVIDTAPRNLLSSSALSVAVTNAILCYPQ